MTPGMKHLCEAADKVMCVVGHGPHGLMDYEAEAIVRAVLMTLKELTEDEYNTSVGSEFYGEKVVAMIDHILAEPAKT